MNFKTKAIGLLAGSALALSLAGGAVAGNTSDAIDVTVTDNSGVTVVVSGGDGFTDVIFNEGTTSTGLLIFTSTDPRFDKTGTWSATASVTAFKEQPEDIYTTFDASIALNFNDTNSDLEIDAATGASGTNVPLTSGPSAQSPTVLTVTNGSNTDQIAAYDAIVTLPPGQAPGEYFATVSVTVTGGGDPS